MKFPPNILVVVAPEFASDSHEYIKLLRDRGSDTFANTVQELAKSQELIKVTGDGHWDTPESYHCSRDGGSAVSKRYVSWTELPNYILRVASRIRRK